MKKIAKNQPIALESFIKWCSHHSPFAVLAGIVFSFVFCAIMIDYTYFSIVFSNVFYGTVAIFCAFFILIVRGALLFHSFNGFSTGRHGMGTLSAILQIGAVIWVCYEAPKAAIFVSDSIELKQAAATNFIRMVAIIATLLEVLMILSIKDMYIDEEDQNDTFNDVTKNLAERPLPQNGNGQGKELRIV